MKEIKKKWRALKDGKSCREEKDVWKRLGWSGRHASSTLSLQPLQEN